jgi:hypothetical protein
MFTKKDFLLLEDAVNDGLRRFFNMPGLTRTLNPDAMPGIERMLRIGLADALAEKLKYTSDGFDAAKFKRSITDAESEAKKIQKALDKPAPVG